MPGTLITDRQSGAATYKILRRLGKGGMAEVFLARQEGMAGFKRLAVVKRLLPQFSSASNVAEMLLDEARIVAQLSQPNIVQIYELGKEENQYFIVMEYVDGCDLATLARIERRRKSRVPIRLALRVVSEAAMGLDYAHRQHGFDGRPLNIVHRDVSPHNVLCSREGAVKVGDFGIAKAVGKAGVTDVGVVKGKVQYMAPEQYTGAEVDGRADIFSLGVVLYQLTVGRLPRVTKDGNVAMRRVIEGKIPRPSELRPDFPEELEEILMRALQHKPDDRYADAARFRDSLLEFARQNDLLAFPKELGDYVNKLVPPQPLSNNDGRPSTVIISKTMAPQSSNKEAEESATGPPPNTEVVSKKKPLKPDSLSVPESVSLDSSSDYGSLEQSTNARSASDNSTNARSGSDNGASARSASTRSASARSASAKSAPVQQWSVPSVPRSKSEENSAPAVLSEEVLTPLPGERGVETRAARRPINRQTPEADVDHDHYDSHQEQLAARRSDPEWVSLSLEEHEQEPLTRTPVGRRPTTTKTTTTTPRRPEGRQTSVWLAFAAIILSTGVAVYLFAYDRKGNKPTPVKLGSSIIEVSANPHEAEVSVDGAQRCAATPCRIGGLPLGRELLVTVKAPEHSIWLQRVLLTSAEPKLLLIAHLNRRTEAADANAAKAPTKAHKAKQRVHSTQRHKTKRSPGTKRAATKKPEKKPPSKAEPPTKPTPGGHVVTVPSGNPQVAILVIDVRPAWAEVWVNGQKVGVTPLQRQIQPGTYKIELKNPQFKYHRLFTITPELGKKIKISDQIKVEQSDG